MTDLIRQYFDACNAGDAASIAACFTADAVHYFPHGMYGGPFRGAVAIGQSWQSAVATLGSRWTIDKLLCDPDSWEAVIEWSHFKTSQQKLLRGDEWYVFDPTTGLIKEIRAYYASPQAPTFNALELEGFDYEGRGYAITPPP